MMKKTNFRKLDAILLLMIFFLPISSILASDNEKPEPKILENSSDSDQDEKSFLLGDSASHDIKSSISGGIENRIGKIFSNITPSEQSSYIDRNTPSLNQQPNVYLNDWNLTHAKIHLEDIIALNHTYNLETQSQEFFVNYYDDRPFYIYQKFWVEVDQYVNNISIFIQDICDLTNFTEANSWEVAVLNCSDNEDGKPDAVLGALSKPHPLNYNAKWELFDFQNSDIGPIFLNISNTNYTTEDEVRKHWFAYRVKIPPYDDAQGGGPKFLYFNPDDGDFTDNGVGDTYAYFSEAQKYKNFTRRDVNDTMLKNCTLLSGDLDSFKEFDDDEYQIESLTDNLTIAVNYEIGNLTEDEGYTFEDINWLINNAPGTWELGHPYVLYGLDVYFSLNISNLDIMKRADFLIYNYSADKWIDISDSFDPNRTINEVYYLPIRDADTKAVIISCMNFTNDRNNLWFRFDYNSTGTQFNVTIDQLTMDVLFLEDLSPIQRFDPKVQELYYPREVSIDNGTEIGMNSLEDLRLNDDKYYEAQSDTNNMSLEFDYEFVPYLNSSYWDVDIYDWQFVYENPVIPQIDLRLSSNISINSHLNLSTARLDIYKGNEEYYWLSEEENAKEWLNITGERDLAFATEYQLVEPLPAQLTWIIMQLTNSSENNLLKMRLVYRWNESLYPIKNNFNVTIDEFAFNVHVQNAKTSDITSKIGFGMAVDDTKPSLIQLKNDNIPVTDGTANNGTWELDISDGIPFQGYYEFNFSSIWPFVRFKVNGIYEIEHSKTFTWNYLLDDSFNKVLWNASASLNYFSNSIDESRGIVLNIPKEWELMSIYNETGQPPGIGITDGYWYSESNIQNTIEFLKVYNLSDGEWSIKLNSSRATFTKSWNKLQSAYLDEFLNLDLTIHDHFGGKMYFEIYDTDDRIVFQNSTELNENGQENSTVFKWKIFNSINQPGTYTVKSYWIDSNSTHAFIALETDSFEIKQYKTKLELIGIDEIESEAIYGSKVVIRGKLTNQDTDEPIAGEELTITILNQNAKEIDEIKDITNADGIIEVEYEIPEGNERISVVLSYTAEDGYFASSESSEELEINTISQEQAYLNTFLDYLPYIAIAAIITAGLLLARRRHYNKLRQEWAQDALVLEDLLKISYIMIIHKDVGVAIYSKQISSEEIDSDLIGGFLHAISQFRREFKKGEVKDSAIKKGFEMDYYDFKIILADGQFIRVALVLEGSPSEQLKQRQREFVEHFERRFGKFLKNFDGAVKPFQSSDELVEQYFNTSLMYPLTLSSIPYDVKTTELEEALLEVAEQMMKERKFFFVSSLLSYGIAGRKESRDHVISAILSLREKQLIEPIQLE